jgi:putative CocE/NonD family hydrolase
MAPQESATAATAVLVELDVPMTTRDGTVLRANVYRPSGEGPWPVLLTRLPYGKDNPPVVSFHVNMLDPMTAARRGYIVVVQDVRGTFASDGQFQPFRNEYTDGADTVAWAKALPGSSGAVGVYGCSYFGHTSLAAAVDDCGAVKALIPRMRCADPLNGMYFRQGAFELTMQASWYLGMAVAEAARQHSHDPARFDEVMRELVASIDALGDRGYAHRPLDRFTPLWNKPLGEAFLTPLEHPMDAEALDDLDITKRMDRISAPALHLGGWYDIFYQQTLDDFMAMRSRGVPTRLIMGTSFHNDVTIDPVGARVFGVAAQDVSHDLTDTMCDIQLRWMDRWLKEDAGDDEPAVKIFVMGENRWREFADWPPPATETAWFLHPDGGLATTTPPDCEPDGYTYDPDDPAPTLGGAIMSDPAHPAGVFDQRPVEARPDVLSYTSDELEEDLEVVGRLTVRLWARTDAVDTDFVVRLCDVQPDGASLNLADGIVRALYRDAGSGAAPSLVEPGQAYEYVIDLWSTANVFRAGHRIRLDVTSSNFPRWDANPNTGTPFSSANCVPARQQILHDPAHPSRMLLPVLSPS